MTIAGANASTLGRLYREPQLWQCLAVVTVYQRNVTSYAMFSCGLKLNQYAASGVNVGEKPNIRDLLVSAYKKGLWDLIRQPMTLYSSMSENMLPKLEKRERHVVVV